MSKKGLFFTLLILLILFGGAVWSTSHPEILNKIKMFNSTTVKPTQNVNSFLPALPSKVTTEEMKRLSSGPAKGAKEADFKKYSSDVNTASVMSDVLDISGCMPTPNILSFSPDKTLTIINKDSTSHSISVFLKGVNIVLANPAARSQVKMYINQLKPGIYSYVCDTEGPAGMFLVQ